MIGRARIRIRAFDRRVSVFGAGAVAVWLAFGCAESVIRTGSENEVNRAVAVLERHGVPAEVETSARGRSTTFEVFVDPGDAARARAILGAHGLPKADRPGLSAMGAGAGLVPSPVEERARIAAAVVRDLEQSLEAVDGVVEARVHVAFPLADDPAFGRDEAARASRASVLIRHAQQNAPLEVSEIRRLVAGAADGVDPDGVEVVFRPVVVPAASDDVWRSFGPFVIRSGSRGPLMALVLGLLGAVAALAALLVWTRVSARRRGSGEGG